MLKTKFESYSDGLVSIYKVENVALPGDMPSEGLILKNSLRYHERTVGMSRYFAAMQNSIKVDSVIRCPEVRGLSEKATDILVAIPIDGYQYKVIQIQYIEDAVPASMDLSLERVGSDYAIN